MNLLWLMAISMLQNKGMKHVIKTKVSSTIEMIDDRH
jgi:hypothetical protein